MVEFLALFSMNSASLGFLINGLSGQNRVRKRSGWPREMFEIFVILVILSDSSKEFHQAFIDAPPQLGDATGLFPPGYFEHLLHFPPLTLSSGFLISSLQGFESTSPDLTQKAQNIPSGHGINAFFLTL